MYGRPVDVLRLSGETALKLRRENGFVGYMYLD